MLRDDPNESSAVYLLTSDDKHAVCGTDFSKSTSLPKIFSVVLLCRGDFRSRAGQRKRSSFTDMQIWDEPMKARSGQNHDNKIALYVSFNPTAANVMDMLCIFVITKQYFFQRVCNYI